MNEATHNPIIAFDKALADFEKPLSATGATPGRVKGASEALKELINGNGRFKSSERPCFEIGKFDPEIDPPEQNPIAAVVCCSDSRVPPELIFWQGLGKLFIVRAAGNTVDKAALASLVYAVSALCTPLIVVLGHERCGAVSAAVKFVHEKEPYDSAIAGIVEPILPAVIKAKHDCNVCREVLNEPAVKVLVESAVKENVRRTVDALRVSLTAYAKDGSGTERLWIVGARYDLNHGDVDFFYPHAPSLPAEVA